MSPAITTMDSSGRLVLPKSVRDRLRLGSRAKFRVDVVAERIELTPEPGETARIERRGGRLVVVGTEPVDLGEAFGADREDRLEHIRPKP